MNILQLELRDLMEALFRLYPPVAVRPEFAKDLMRTMSRKNHEIDRLTKLLEKTEAFVWQICRTRLRKGWCPVDCNGAYCGKDASSPVDGYNKQTGAFEFTRNVEKTASKIQCIKCGALDPTCPLCHGSGEQIVKTPAPTTTNSPAFIAGLNRVRDSLREQKPSAHPENASGIRVENGKVVERWSTLKPSPRPENPNGRCLEMELPPTTKAECHRCKWHDPGGFNGDTDEYPQCTNPKWNPDEIGCSVFEQKDSPAPNAPVELKSDKSIPVTAADVDGKAGEFLIIEFHVVRYNGGISEVTTIVDFDPLFKIDELKRELAEMTERWISISNSKPMFSENIEKMAEKLDVLVGNVCECGHHENHHPRVTTFPRTKDQHMSYPCFVKDCECKDFKKNEKPATNACVDCKWNEHGNYCNKHDRIESTTCNDFKQRGNDDDETPAPCPDPAKIECTCPYASRPSETCPVHGIGGTNSYFKPAPNAPNVNATMNTSMDRPVGLSRGTVTPGVPPSDKGVDGDEKAGYPERHRFSGVYPEASFIDEVDYRKVEKELAAARAEIEHLHSIMQPPVQTAFTREAGGICPNCKKGAEIIVNDQCPKCASIHDVMQKLAETKSLLSEARCQVTRRDESITKLEKELSAARATITDLEKYKAAMDELIHSASFTSMDDETGHRVIFNKVRDAGKRFGAGKGGDE